MLLLLSVVGGLLDCETQFQDSLSVSLVQMAASHTLSNCPILCGGLCGGYSCVCRYPMVDAGMRELYATGWMHQSVRMICASFLVEYLGLNWTEGRAQSPHTQHPSSQELALLTCFY